MRRCKIKLCERPYYAKEMCQHHFDKDRRHGNPLFERELKKKLLCPVEGCTKNQFANGLCNRHNMQVHRTGGLEYQRLHDGKAQERNRARTAQWKKDNKETYNAYLASRKKRVKQATPKWADLNAIREFYYNCPEGYHVDHIIPLNGKEVSGLHCMENLQYLSAIENLRKSNKIP